jgi:hypothetical protein
LDELPQEIGSTKGEASATDVALRCLYVDWTAPKIRRFVQKTTKYPIAEQGA